MAKMIYTVDLAKGLVSPVPDAIPLVQDKYSTSGAFMPDIGVVDIVNAIPTENGYISYFGENIPLGRISETEEYVQDVIVLRTFNGIMLLLAMCPGGIYLNCPGSKDGATLVNITPVPSITHLIAQKEIALVNGGFAWIRIAGGANPSENPWKWWSHAVVKNKIYFYQQGLGSIVEITDKHPSCVVINWYNPLSIIGTTNVYRWLISIGLNSGCTTTAQTVDFGAVLGSRTISNLHKAHRTAAAAQIWEETIRSFITSAVSAE
jgi:hypothetical protein